MAKDVYTGYTFMIIYDNCYDAFGNIESNII